MKYYKKKIVLVLVVITLVFFIAGLVLYFTHEDEFVEFNPIVINPIAQDAGNLYITDESISIDGEFKENLVFVLNFYRIKYKLINNKIYVGNKIGQDYDYVANLTSKANNPDWIKRQKFLVESKPIE